MSKELDFRSVLSTGDEIGCYRIVGFVGRGGMAEVYEALDTTLDRRVALKVPRADAHGKHSTDRFLLEARKAALINHQNVITIFAAGQHAGLHYLVMQFVDGQDLHELMLARNSALSWSQALKIIRLAARGLHAVHQQGIIHRDLKPSNIMLSADSRVYVMDFGLVRDESSHLTSSGSVLGTPSFMSPEQCRGDHLDGRSDLYSLGATLYNLIAARRPFEGPTLRIVQSVGRGKRPEPIESLVAGLPQDVAKLIDKAMAIRRADRFADAHEMSQSISRLLKAHEPPDTDSWETVSVSPSAVDTSINPGPNEIELTPVVTSSGHRSSHSIEQRRHLLIGISLLVAAVVTLAAVSYFQRTPNDSSISTKASSIPEREGMVFIPAGRVHLSNDEAEWRAFLRKYSVSSSTIDQVVRESKAWPKGTAEVKGFYIDKYEVTNAQYAEFIESTGHPPPPDWSGSRPVGGKEDHPVTSVTYEDVNAYAKWCGKQIPTVQQWIRAYRGDSESFFPWGNDYDASRMNIGDNPDLPLSTTPVDATPLDVSRYGVVNLCGNVAEIIQPNEEPLGSSSLRAKGGAFPFTPGTIFAVANVELQAPARDYIGFRCVVENP